MTNKRLMLTAALAAAANGLVTAGRGEEMPLPRPIVQEAGTGGNMPSMPSSVLQVSGSTNSFVISAQRADVLSLLKLVFHQAHRQFVPDASVTGDVTFALSGQKLETVLDAICRQAFLRCDIDRNDIYQFRRDEQALRNFILKTQVINTALQEQVRRMGYTVPQNLTAGTPGLALNNGLGGGAQGGGFGRDSGVNLGRANSQYSVNRQGGSPSPSGQAGPLGVQNAISPGDIARARSNSPQGVAPVRAKDDNATGAENEQNAKSSGVQEPVRLSTSAGQGEGAGQGQFAPANTPRPVERRAGSTQQSGDPRPAMPNLEDSAQYQLFLKQNNFVMFNTQEQDRPVRDILLDLSRQSGVPIYIDPAVPGGDAFVINGYVTPRPLVEVLNYLAYKARLEWRWINNRVYVTITPQLNLYLHGSLLSPPQGGAGVSSSQQNTRPRQNPVQQRSAGASQNAPALRPAKPLELNKQDQTKPADTDKPRPKEQSE